MLCVVRSVLDILNIFGMEMIATPSGFRAAFPSAELLIAVIQIPPL